MTIITTSIVTQSTTFSILDYLVYTVWACLKGVTPYKTFKEETTNKNHYDDSYSAPFAILTSMNPNQDVFF